MKICVWKILLEKIFKRRARYRYLAIYPSVHPKFSKWGQSLGVRRCSRQSRVSTLTKHFIFSTVWEYLVPQEQWIEEWSKSAQWVYKSNFSLQPWANNSIVQKSLESTRRFSVLYIHPWQWIEEWSKSAQMPLYKWLSLPQKHRRQRSP